MSSDTVVGASVCCSVRVVVVGDHGTGKSSLIVAAASEKFPQSVSLVLPPTHIPADYYPEGVPVIIIDTAYSLEGKAKLEEELKRADVIVLTYACDKPETFYRLQNFWMQEVRRLKVKVPVIVVGCKLDLRNEHNPVSFEHVVAPIMQQYKEIETCIECSAVNLAQVYEVFYCAQKAVLHPLAPLFDQESQRLSRLYIRALERIFILCDHDMDGALNDHELNEFQVKCFGRPLQSSEIVDVKIIVWERVPEGVNEYGITLVGFLFLHALMIEKGRTPTAWTVLHKFGYNNNIELCKENINVSSKKDPGQVQMKNYKATDHGSASVEVMESVKATIEAEKCKLAEMRKEIEEDHERKKLELAEEHEKHKAELDAMCKEFDDQRDKLVEDAMRKLIEKIPPEVAKELLTRLIVHAKY